MGRYGTSDSRWALVAGLLPSRGPRADDRRFVGAVLHVLNSGCPWHDLPPEFGNWNSAWRRSRRWSQSGVRGRVLGALRDADASVLALDSTVARAHRHAAGARKKTGRSRSGAAAAGSARRSTRR